MKALVGAIALVSLASCVADVPLLAADSVRLAYSAVRSREARLAPLHLELAD